MTHLWFKLKAIEVVLNISNLSNRDVIYWRRERKLVLKELLIYQLETFNK